ncbi:integrase core domain-containing protein [Streptomyces sp. NBC_00439]|nr:integrase core domain-containing protein [Streptomyces sp. NBC_00439]
MAPRITRELRESGPVVNHKRVARLMRAAGIAGRHLRKGKRTTVQDVRASDAFAVACRRHGIRRSMGRVGSSYGNAMAESFFASIKLELLHGERWRQNSEARMAVFSWLAWYNNCRRHSALGHLSPVEFERQAITSRSLNLAA